MQVSLCLKLSFDYIGFLSVIVVATFVVLSNSTFNFCISFIYSIALFIIPDAVEIQIRLFATLLPNDSTSP